MAENQAHKARRARSPAYPFIPLSKALDRAKTFYDVEKRHAAPFAVAVSHWDFKPKSSGGLQTVAALKQYGLGQDVGAAKERKVQLTELALRILLDQREGSPDRAASIKSAALKPKIHAEIWGKWGTDLPSDGTLRTFLVLDKKFNEASASDVIGVYKETIQFAKLAEADKVSGDHEDSEDASTEDSQMPTATEEQAPSIALAASKRPSPLTEAELLRLRLSGGRGVRLLFTGTPTQSDIDKLIGLLELSKDGFPKSDEGAAD